MEKKKVTCIKDCFNKDGNFNDKYSPFFYRDNNPSIHSLLFDEDGYAISEAVTEVEKLIEENNWNWKCDAVKYYYAHDSIDYQCGDYPAIFAWHG